MGKPGLHVVMGKLGKVCVSIGHPYVSMAYHFTGGFDVAASHNDA